MTKYDPIRGKTFHWRFEGPLSGTTYEHVFGQNDTVTYRVVDGEAGKMSEPTHYEIASVTTTLCVFSYLADSGYTFTGVLDFHTNQVVAFISNEKELSQHRGSFAVIGDQSDFPAGAKPTVRESRAHN
jgi:hypothetical protein